MFRQLLWKEWREQRWKLIFGTVMLVFFTGTLVVTQLSTAHEVIIVVWLIGGLVLAMYSAMGAFAPETANGTQVFLMTRPIQPWKIFFGKWAMGWLNFAVPMLVCSLALALMALTRSDGRIFELKYIARGTFAGIGFGTMLYTMTCCLAPRKSGEATVGFTGLILCLAFTIWLIIVISITGVDKGKQLSLPVELFLYLTPLTWPNFMTQMTSGMHLWLIVIEQFVLFVLTILYGYRRWRRS